MAHRVGPPPAPSPRRWIGPVILAVAVFVVLAGALALNGGGPSGASPAPSDGVAVVASASPVASLDGGSPGATDEPSGPAASESPDPSPSAEPAGPAEVAIAPVVPFRSARTGTRRADVAGLAGGDSPFRGLVLVERDADGILDALGLDRAALGKRLVTVPSAERLAADLATHPARIGFLRADEVGPSVRAVSWGGKSLFGTDRVKGLAGWPLVATLEGPAADAPTYDPAEAWTMFAGGDILLDRGVALAIQANDADFPFDGGTAEVTGRCKDCSPLGWDTPYTRRTGNAGAVRELISGADLAIANFENPAPNRFTFHDHGTTFSANPAYIEGLKNAGIDWVSLANNHAADQGTTGILQTMRNLDRQGIEHGGAGRTFDKAHEATLIEVGDVTVGLLGYDAIRPAANADADTPGTARITKANLKRDIKAAREAGAEVVVVFPHWGVEYRADPVASQERLGRAAIDAGADMVIGNHPHWAQGMEVYNGKPIWYGLGNFVFDQTWSEYTMEGLTLELTFKGKDLVQARMRPHIILGKAQANFLDPAGSGKFVMDQVWDASEGRLPW
jgi:poly-gamma-glutamate synthesis protein (capsule biosynthesis protein)